MSYKSSLKFTSLLNCKVLVLDRSFMLGNFQSYFLHVENCVTNHDKSSSCENRKLRKFDGKSKSFLL